MYRLILRNSFGFALKRHTRGQYITNSQPLEAGFGKIILIATPFIGIGGVIAYAKYNKNYREFLEKNVPGAEYILKVAFSEEKPFEKIGKQLNEITDSFQSISKQIDKTTKTIGGATSSITGFFSSTSESTKTLKNAESDKPKASPVSPTKQEFQKTVTKDAVTKSKTVEPVKISNPVDTLPTDVVELEKAAEVAASLAVKEYNKAIGILKVYNEDVRKVVDHAIEYIDPTSWMTLKNKTSARDTAVATAEKLAREALTKIEKCEIALSKAASSFNHERVLEVRNKIKLATDHINVVKDELYKTKDVATLSEKYWKNVESARNYFLDEIESIFPGISLAEKKLDLPKEDLDIFIMHAYSHVLAYQKELERIQTDGELQLKRALEAFRSGSQPEVLKAQIDYHLETERRKLAIENQKKIFKIRADSEREMRKQLKLQSQAHVDHLSDSVALKESELKRNFSKELDEKLSSEKAAYKLQLATMLGKLRGMDSALKARAETERSAQQAQALWAACQALWATVRTGEPGVHWSEKLRPLKSEIKAVGKVAEGDELVAVVLQNLSKEAENRGVFPEDALRERFLRVEKIARRLALVPAENAGVGTYLLSYLQSMFILSTNEPLSKNELQNKVVDFSKLDTYDILNRARYYVDRGDLMQALKYMNLLQGAPRKIASDWLKETRLMLETQQAANTLMAHAAASGLLYL